VATWTFPEQAEAKRLLEGALSDGPAHAYLFHGPPGVGKRLAARELAAQLLGDERRVLRGAHPDLYVLEALGDMIRIDATRELRRDLHMRPFEADRRVYLIFDAELLNEEAADALLKDLEEPPPYAVLVLVADDLGPIPETIRSRCQLVPFSRLSERAIREALDRRAPGLGDAERTALARVSAGRLDRMERLLDPHAAARRAQLLELARAVYRNDGFEPADAAARIVEASRERSREAKEHEEEAIASFDLPAREAEQRVRRAGRGAEREELLDSLEELAAWYRDLIAVAVGAEGVVVHADRISELREDADPELVPGAERAAEAVRATWRELEELNLAPQLAFEALFVRLRRALAASAMLTP
jgi:DNA polymerase-3 subunit delta'